MVIDKSLFHNSKILPILSFKKAQNQTFDLCIEYSLRPENLSTQLVTKFFDLKYEIVTGLFKSLRHSLLTKLISCEQTSDHLPEKILNLILFY